MTIVSQTLHLSYGSCAYSHNKPNLLYQPKKIPFALQRSAHQFRIFWQLAGRAFGHELKCVKNNILY